MYKILEESIKFTHKLGDFEAFKYIIDDEGNITMKASSSAFDAILDAKFKTPVTEFARPDMDKKNSIGFLNLSVLNGYLSSGLFDENANITSVTRELDNAINALEFKNQSGNKCRYRTLAPDAAKKQIKTLVKSGGFNTTIEFKPTKTFLYQLRNLGKVLESFSKNFSFEVKDDMLYAILGNVENRSEIPITECFTPLKREILVPFKRAISILSAVPNIEDVVIKINEDDELVNIEFETDQAFYVYTLNTE